MTTFVKEGTSLECNKSDIHIRKVTGPILIEIEGIGKFYKYKSKIRAIVLIIEELVPKVHRICCDSKLDLNDSLEGVTLEILTEKRIRDWILTPNFSNVHGIQSNRTNSFTYAKIVIPWRFVTQQIISSGTKALTN